MPRKISFKALKVSQNIGTFYMASMDSRDLVDISFSDVRRMYDDDREVERYLGIQRPVSKTRVKQIKKYLEGKDATFPTAIILAVEDKCAEYDEANCELTLSEYVPEEDSDEDTILYNKIARVLDGQHRIAAFIDDDDNYLLPYREDQDTFELNLAIFVGADIAEQANIFATVNLAQTKVNRSLVYDLTELAKARSPYKTCHEVAVMLDREKSSPLYRRIKRLGVATPGRAKEPLTQAAFVESLSRFISPDPTRDRNSILDGKKIPKPTYEELLKHPFRSLFLQDKDLDIGEILYNYFSAVRKKWPNAWNDIDTKGNLLPKSNAFKALMKFLKEDVYLEIVSEDFGAIPSESQFYSYFENIQATDSDFTTRNFVPGSGGQSAFLKLLRQQITINEMIEG